MKKFSTFLIAAAAVPLAVLASLTGCALREFGQAPKDVSSYENLPYFADGKFRNLEGDTPFYPDRVRGGKPSRYRHLFPSPNAPEVPLPIVKLDKNAFAETPEELAVTWLGHASLIIELEGKRFLVDPIFDNAAPIPFAVPRYVPPPLKRKELPLPDVVLITHDHYDHLEYATIRHFKDKETLFIVPLGVGSHLLKWGVPPEKIRELGWSDEFSENGIRIVAEPAVHFSARTWSSRNDTLWASYVLKGNQRQVFISGDTGYSEHFRDIGAKHGPFDIAFFEIDAWNPGWPKSHLFPAEVIRAYHDVRAASLMPVHWGVFDLALHPWDESIRMVAALADEDGNVNLITPRMGQKWIPGTTTVSRWWENLPGINNLNLPAP
ncbi:MAG: MBL fold metallo-hydrolase [Proteobacteria bacterium]|nr:MBL fold metallo-hydrolase [Pseudomonadota bacterium]MCL2306832.1 MBL fold metallo-hydrolase [Pseudomonadota bacterium]